MTWITIFICFYLAFGITILPKLIDWYWKKTHANDETVRK